MNLGHAIKICRTHRGLNQGQLAALSGISLSYLSLIENNKRDPGMTTIEAISEALGLPPTLLLFLAADSGELHGLPADVQEKMSSLTLRLLSRADDTAPQLPLPSV